MRAFRGLYLQVCRSRTWCLPLRTILHATSRTSWKHSYVRSPRGKKRPRHPNFPHEFKITLAEQSLQPGACVAQIARDISAINTGKVACCLPEIICQNGFLSAPLMLSLYDWIQTHCRVTRIRWKRSHICWNRGMHWTCTAVMAGWKSTTTSQRTPYGVWSQAGRSASSRVPTAVENMQRCCTRWSAHAVWTMWSRENGCAISLSISRTGQQTVYAICCPGMLSWHLCKDPYGSDDPLTFIWSRIKHIKIRPLLKSMYRLAYIFL